MQTTTDDQRSQMVTLAHAVADALGVDEVFISPRQTVIVKAQRGTRQAVAAVESPARIRVTQYIDPGDAPKIHCESRTYRTWQGAARYAAQHLDAPGPRKREGEDA